MSKITLTFLFILVGYAAIGQVGIGTNNPNPKSVLELSSPTNNQGFLVPRLTSAQRTAIAPTATDKGLLVFDTDSNKFHFWSGSAWIIIEDGTGTDNQTLTFTPATGLLAISGGNNVTITGTVPGGAAGGDLTGTYPNPTITNNAITTAKIADGTITNADVNAAAGIVVTKLAAGTNGQVLTTVGTTPTWSTMALGTLTSITAGTGLTGGTITTTGTIGLANTTVTPGNYGSANQVSTFTVDAQGRLTAAANTTITGVAPGGVAGGDLTGTYPNPTVANNAITSAKIADATIATADLADGSVNTAKILDATISTTDLADGSVDSNKILDGSIANADINATAGIVVTKLAAGTNGQVLLTNAGVPTWTTPSFSPAGAAGGDLTGTYPNPTVANNAITSAKIADATIATADLADGSVNTAKILDATISTIDLADGSVDSNKILDGSIANADINATAGIVVTKLAAGTNGQVLLTNAGIPTWTTPSFSPAGAAGGDLTGTYPNPTVTNNAITSAKIADASILNADINAAAGIVVTKLAAGTNGQVLLTNAGVPTWTTPSFSPAGAAGGDLTGTYPNPTVTNGAITSAKILDGTISSADILDATIVTADLANLSVTDANVANVAPSKILAGGATTNQVLKWNGSAWAPGADDNTIFSLPYLASVSATGTTPVFQINNDGTTNARVGQFSITNAANGQSALVGTTLGAGAGVLGSGTLFGVAGLSTTQGGAAGYFVNTADRGFGVYGSLNTAGTTSAGVLGTTFLNDGVHFGVGVFGVGDDYGVRGQGGIYGGEFLRTATSTRVLLAGSGAGVFSSTNEAFVNGVTGVGNGTLAYGVYGSGTAAGVSGYSDTGNALDGFSNSTTTGYAVYGLHGQTTGTNAAIRGETNSTAAFAEAVTGAVTSTTPGGSSAGIRGINNGTGFLGIGVWGSHAGSGWGVYGQAPLSGFAGYFSGRVNVTGALSKGSGTFKIDHPLDPSNKYLYHSFVESPDMKNIYDGVVTLGADGEAEVSLPEWFEALNKDFRYQLTCIGGFANVFVAEEIQGNRFRIGGGRPGLKVSWQVTGIRKDPYAEKNRVVVEENKPAHERGKYLYPEAYGLPIQMSVDYAQTQGATQPVVETSTNRSAEEKRQLNTKILKQASEYKPAQEAPLKPAKLN